MRVMKFGGAALRDGEAVRRAVGIVREFGGGQPIVVVSAHAGVTLLLEGAFSRARAGDLEWDPLRIRHRTLLRQLDLPDDLLDRQLRELRGSLSWVAASAGRVQAQTGALGSLDAMDLRRMRDLVLSFGERLSARIFAAALRSEGVEATPMDAHDLGLLSGREGLGPPERARAGLLETLGRAPGIPVVTGFFALDGQGHLATLGRNGSDLTATWLGAAIGASEVQLWKRVPGILTADPFLVPGAHPIARLDWAQAEALARHGSGVLHPDAVAPARNSSVPLVVRDLDDPAASGTRITSERTECVAIAHRTGLARLKVMLEEDRALRLAQLFARFAEAGVEPYLASVRATLAEVLVSDCPEVESIAREFGTQVETRRGLATVALIGPGSAHVEVRRRRAIELAFRVGGEEFSSEADLDTGLGRDRVLVFPNEVLVDLVPRMHESFVVGAASDA